MKKTEIKQLPPTDQKPRIKYVKKAKMWCKTTWVNGHQKQEWSLEKPKLLN